MRFSIKRRWTPARQGFTIREILVIIVIVSVGLLSVVVVLTNGMKYVQKTRQKVIALNLAREWMEAVYQIRDTNRTRRAWVKDKCWLKINPLVDDYEPFIWATPSCINDIRFASGSYVLQRLSTGGQEYFALTGPWSALDISSLVTTDPTKFSLCQQSGYRNSCMWRTWTTSEWRYYREIVWLWLYLKDVPASTWNDIVCSWWTVFWWNPDCGTSSAKEFRFCSRVVYIGDGTGEVQLCGVITNFRGEE